MRRRSGTLLFTLFLSGAIAAGAGRPVATVPISATAPMGSVANAWLTIGNTAGTPVTASLYEALQPDAAHKPAPPPTPLRVAMPDAPGPITADLLAELSGTPNDQAEMLVYLSSQADLSAAAALPDWN